MSELFRREATTYATRRLAGEVVLASPLSTKLLAGGAIALVGAAVVFAATATYARKETVAGWLVPQGGLIRVTARQGGIVEQLAAREGGEVRAGAPLAVLRLSSELGDGDAGAALGREISSELAATQAQAQAERAKLTARRRQLADQRAMLVRELAEVRRRVAALDERAALARTNAERYEQISARGFLSKRDLEAARASVLIAEQDAAEVRGQSLAYERQVGDLDAQLVALPMDFAVADARAQAATASLAQKRTVNAAQSTYVASATLAGRVVAVPVERGQAVAPGGVVAVLTPADGGMEAELYVPSRAAGFIRPGQEVRLMYQAFPHQKFGTARGVVRTASRTVLAPNEVAIPGLSLAEPVFKVRVKLDRGAVDAYGQVVPLQPGMLLTADVVIDRRTLLEWLFDPLYAAGRRT